MEKPDGKSMKVVLLEKGRVKAQRSVGMPNLLVSVMIIRLT